MSDKNYYAVMRLEKYLQVMGQDIPLPEGQFIIPVFNEYDKALEYSDNGRFKILTLNEDETRKGN